MFTLSANVTGGVRYAYEIWASVLRTAGGGGGSLQYAINGTAAYNDHNYVAYTNTSASNTTITTTQVMYGNTTVNFSTFTNITSNPGNGTYNHMMNVKGTVGVAVSGTITPQISLSGGTVPTAFQVAPGGWMKLYPLGVNTGNLAVGNWSFN